MKNLEKRKALASKVLGVGKGRICFDSSRLAEIKEAITKQDIKDLHAEGVITIKQIKGRKTVEKRKTKRGYGKFKKKIKYRKENYVKITRKLRRYLKELRKQNKLTGEKYRELREKIKARIFPDKAHLREHIGGLTKKQT